MLIENPDRAVARATEKSFREQGWDVVICPGPKGLESGTCARVADGSCPAADEADAILFGLPLDDVDARSVLWAHRPDASTRPVIVEASNADLAEFASVLHGLTIAVSDDEDARVPPPV